MKNNNSSVSRLLLLGSFLVFAVHSVSAVAGIWGLASSTANPVTNSTYTLSWDDVYADCSLDYYELRQDGGIIYSGCGLSHNVTNQPDGTYDYELSLCIFEGEIGDYICIEDGGITVVADAPSPVLDHFYLTDYTIFESQITTAEWGSTGAQNCYLVGYNDVYDKDGPLTTVPSTFAPGAYDFQMYCTGLGGTSNTLPSQGSLTLTVEAEPALGTSGSGFDTTYLIYENNSNDNLYIERNPNASGATYIDSFFLVKQNPGDPYTISTSESTSGYTLQPSITYGIVDYNADGRRDMRLSNLPDPNDPDVVVYSSSSPNSPMATREIDDSFTNYFSELFRFLDKPKEFYTQLPVLSVETMLVPDITPVYSLIQTTGFATCSLYSIFDFSSGFWDASPPPAYGFCNIFQTYATWFWDIDINITYTEVPLVLYDFSDVNLEVERITNQIRFILGNIANGEQPIPQALGALEGMLQDILSEDPALEVLAGIITSGGTLPQLPGTVFEEDDNIYRAYEFIRDILAGNFPYIPTDSSVLVIDETSDDIRTNGSSGGVAVIGANNTISCDLPFLNPSLIPPDACPNPVYKLSVAGFADQFQANSSVFSMDFAASSAGDYLANCGVYCGPNLIGSIERNQRVVDQLVVTWKESSSEVYGFDDWTPPSGGALLLHPWKSIRTSATDNVTAEITPESTATDIVFGTTGDNYVSVSPINATMSPQEVTLTGKATQNGATNVLVYADLESPILNSHINLQVFNEKPYDVAVVVVNELATGGTDVGWDSTDLFDTMVEAKLDEVFSEAVLDFNVTSEPDCVADFDIAPPNGGLDLDRNETIEDQPEVNVIKDVCLTPALSNNFDFVLFFVDNLQLLPASSDIVKGVSGGAGSKWFIVDASQGAFPSVTETVAHEAGHNLGLIHVDLSEPNRQAYTDPENIMCCQSGISNTDIRLRKWQWDKLQ